MQQLLLINQLYKVIFVISAQAAQTDGFIEVGSLDRGPWLFTEL